jgi:NAD(P)-dependent dehydrogenase (short-subunit alcohol dehydrogenase family)
MQIYYSMDDKGRWRFSIVNIGSGVAYMGFTRAQDAYTASKGALISLTRSMAIVYAKKNIMAQHYSSGTS